MTPASSVFIIIPFILLYGPDGAFLRSVFAAIIGVFMAFCWGELSAAFPIAGGDYALVWHAFKGPWARVGNGLSFATFALMLNSVAFIPAVIALGTAEYVSNVVTIDTRIAGAVVCLLAAGVAILRIRTNAILTGIFLVIELLALLVLVVLGVLNFHADRVGQLFSGWVVGKLDGRPRPGGARRHPDGDRLVGLRLQRLLERRELLRGDEGFQPAHRYRHHLVAGHHRRRGS